MFETVAPETFQNRSKKLFYETLPLSIALHALAIAAGVVVAVWNVGFPESSPRVSVAYSLTKVPDPPPPPPPPPRAAAPQPAAPKPVPPPPVLLSQILAPTVIPDKIPDVIAPPPAPPPPAPVPETSSGGPSGPLDGIIGGDLGGRVGGVIGGVAFPDDGRVHIDRNEKLPMESVEQEYPRYPSEAQKKHLEDQVVVRYIIGTDGRVKEVEIISHANEKMFDDAAVNAIRKWRFRPMIKDGKKVEVVHELAVNFQLITR